MRHRGDNIVVVCLGLLMWAKKTSALKPFNCCACFYKTWKAKGKTASMLVLLFFTIHMEN